MMLAWEISWLVVVACFSIFLGGLLAIVGLPSWRSTMKAKRLPPGPKGVPLFGYLPFIRKPFHLAFNELSQKYGPILRLRLGSKNVVVLNDLASIREGLANPDVLYRPEDFLFSYFGFKGIASLNGEAWQVNRRYCFHVLRNLGFAKKSMEEHIKEEVQWFVDVLASKKGRPTLVAQQLAASVANNIAALVFGQRFDLDDPKGRLIEGLLSKMLLNASILSIMDFLPALRAVCRYVPNTKPWIANYVLKSLAQVIRNEVKDREGHMDEYLDRDFIDGYLRKMQENGATESHYTLRYLEGNSINLFGAATNTVRSAILWNLYIAASDPDGHQTRVQREIDAVVGREKPPCWEDRRRMPFTMASILEALRWRTTAPVGIQRSAGRDTVIGGYDVPAGTFVIANLWSLHNDPAHWKNPSEYDPTRFLDRDGKELAEKPLAFLPFSVGRRACPGESLGLMEVFLYVTTLLQKFRVLPEEGNTVSLDAQHAFISVANDTQRLRFVQR
ncbi:cytochrome P450 2F5-like [Amblyomma americanum]